MRFNKLDLNLLVALDALLSEQSISRAGEKIHLSQSAMSNALARLREYFEDELLVQVGRKMEPTPRAEALRDHVRDILLRIDATVAAQPEFVPAEANRLSRMFVSDARCAGRRSYDGAGDPMAQASHVGPRAHLVAWAIESGRGGDG